MIETDGDKREREEEKGRRQFGECKVKKCKKRKNMEKDERRIEKREKEQIVWRKRGKNRRKERGWKERKG